MAGELPPWLGTDNGKQTWLAVRDSVLVSRAWVGPSSAIRGGRACVGNHGRAAPVEEPKRRGQAIWLKLQCGRSVLPRARRCGRCRTRCTSPLQRRPRFRGRCLHRLARPSMTRRHTPATP